MTYSTHITLCGTTLLLKLTNNKQNEDDVRHNYTQPVAMSKRVLNTGRKKLYPST